MEIIDQSNTQSTSSYLTRALVQKCQSAGLRRRGVDRRRGLFLTAMDPETPRANMPQIRNALEVKALRSKLGLSSIQFAKALNIHPDTVRKYEASSPLTYRFPSMVCFRLMEFIERNPALIESFSFLPHFTGPAIKELRGHLRISQNVMANLLGTNRSTYITWERGKRNPSGPAAHLLLIALKHPNEVVPGIHE